MSSSRVHQRPSSPGQLRVVVRVIQSRIMRIALLRMLPKEQRKAIWETANKLYPTFTELLAKVQEMVQDDIDKRQGADFMDVDHVDDDEEGWQSTGQVLTGKGAHGEEALFTLQRRGNAMRVAPKGGGKGG